MGLRLRQLSDRSVRRCNNGYPVGGSNGWGIFAENVFGCRPKMKGVLCGIAFLIVGLAASILTVRGILAIRALHQGPDPTTTVGGNTRAGSDELPAFLTENAAAPGRAVTDAVDTACRTDS